MTISLELNPEIETRIVTQAAERGIPVEQYTQQLLREALALHPKPYKKPSPEEIREMLRAMAEGSEKLPHLPTSAFSRESFYEGRE